MTPILNHCPAHLMVYRNHLTLNHFTLGIPGKKLFTDKDGSKTGYNGDTLSCQIDIRAEEATAEAPC